MGLFDRFKKKQEPVKTTSTPVRTAAPTIQFYNDCVEDYHKAALAKGFANRGLIFIPELVPIGEKTVLAFLKDPFFQMQFGGNPQMYYYVIMSLSLQAGMVFAEKWHSNFPALKSGYVEQIIQEGPADACKPLLAQLGLTDNEKENASKLLSETFSLIDSAVSKGILQKATANRKKARLSLYGNK